MRKKRGTGKETRQCEICGKTFISPICNKKRFCSWECGYKGRSVNKNQKEFSCATCGKVVLRSPSQTLDNVFCSRICSGINQKGKTGQIKKRDPSKRVTLVCKVCGTTFERFVSRTIPGKDTFCSQSCSAKHTNKYKRGCKSKLEKWLGIKLKERSLPVLLNNREILNGYELDIYFPTKNIAIEIDGPWHRLPLNGERHFNQIKFNDALKETLCKNLGIKLIRIPNEGTFSEQIGESVLHTIDEIIPL